MCVCVQFYVAISILQLKFVAYVTDIILHTNHLLLELFMGYVSVSVCVCLYIQTLL
jgi:hypothetical protein